MSAPASAPSLSQTSRTALPLAIQILYGIGEIPVTATMGLFGIYVLLFYNSVMHLEGTLAGLGISAGLVIDAVLDPYIGFRCDQSRSRLGRRQAYMLFGCLGMGPFFFALLSPPRSLNTPLLFVWLLICSLGFRFCFAVYRIPYLSLGAELSSDYDERTRVIAVRSLLGLAGMASAATIPLLVFFRRTGAEADPQLSYAGYPAMGLAFGLLMTLSGLVAVWGTRDRRTFGVPSPRWSDAHRFFKGMHQFFQNRNFRALWISFTLCSLSVVLNFTLNVHYLKWYAGIEDHRWLSAIRGSFFGAAAAGVAAWMFLAKRGEKRNFYVASVLGLAGVLALAALAVGRAHILGTENPLPLLWGNVLAGLFASALWVLPFSMMADVVDDDEARTGERREGACFGIMNFGEKIASGAGLLLSGILLSSYVHLVPGQDGQTLAAVQRIGIAYGLIPGVLLVIAAVMVSRFSLTRRAIARIQAELRRPST